MGGVGSLGAIADIADSGYTTVNQLPTVAVAGSGAHILVGTYSRRNEVTTYSDPAMQAPTRDRFLSITSGPVAFGTYSGQTSAQASPSNALTFAVVLENANPADAVLVEFAAFEWLIESGTTAVITGFTLTPEIGAVSVVGGRTVNLTELVQTQAIGALSIIADINGPAMFRLPGAWQTHTVQAAWEDKITVPGQWRII